MSSADVRDIGQERVRRLDEVRAAVDRKGGGGHDGGMPPDQLAARVGKLEDKVDKIIVELAELKGKISNLPTTFQVITWVASLNLALALGVSALVFAIARAMR